jgi:hypothetical protein
VATQILRYALADIIPLLVRFAQERLKGSELSMDKNTNQFQMDRNSLISLLETSVSLQNKYAALNKLGLSFEIVADQSAIILDVVRKTVGADNIQLSEEEEMNRITMNFFDQENSADETLDKLMEFSRKRIPADFQWNGRRYVLESNESKGGRLNG